MFSMFRRQPKPPETPVKAPQTAFRREPSLIRRQALGDGTAVLSVRLDPASPWFEVARSWPDAPASMAELDRLQRVYAVPLVREVFLELNGQEVPL